MSTSFDSDFSPPSISRLYLFVSVSLHDLCRSSRSERLEKQPLLALACSKTLRSLARIPGLFNNFKHPGFPGQNAAKRRVLSLNYKQEQNLIEDDKLNDYLSTSKDETIFSSSFLAAKLELALEANRSEFTINRSDVEMTGQSMSLLSPLLMLTLTCIPPIPTTIGFKWSTSPHKTSYNACTMMYTDLICPWEESNGFSFALQGVSAGACD